MSEQLFLYRFEFRSRDNPLTRKDEFQEHLKAYLNSKGLQYGMSANGGSRFTLGYVYREGAALTERDRQAFVAWVREQPIKCKVHIGDMEPDTSEVDYFREIPEWVFELDNLSDQDKRVAQADWQRLDARIQAAILRRQDDESGDSSDCTASDNQ